MNNLVRQCSKRIFHKVIWICPIVKPLFPGTPHPLTLNSKRFGHQLHHQSAIDWMLRFFISLFKLKSTSRYHYPKLVNWQNCQKICEELLKPSRKSSCSCKSFSAQDFFSYTSLRQGNVLSTRLKHNFAITLVSGHC